MPCEEHSIILWWLPKAFLLLSFLGTQPRSPWTGSFSVWSVGMPASTPDAAELTELTRVVAPVTGAIVMIKVLEFPVDPNTSTEKVYCHAVLIKRVLNFSAMIKSKLIHAQK